jgi:Vitamin K epoxide reductase family
MSASGRWAVVALSLVGAAIAAYLTLVQVGSVGHPWDPVFGHGSYDVLHSAFSRSLPFPDAAAGLVAYLTEAALGIVGSPTRWERRPVLALMFDLVGLGLATVAVGLVLLQAFVVDAWCLLCLGSAVVSWAILAIGRLREGRAAVRLVRRRCSEGATWTGALLGSVATSRG